MYDRLLELYVELRTTTTNFLRREEGQGITEYILILGFVVLVVALAITQTGIDDTLSAKLSSITGGI